jgi:hypothetical protein
MWSTFHLKQALEHLCRVVRVATPAFPTRAPHVKIVSIRQPERLQPADASDSRVV